MTLVRHIFSSKKISIYRIFYMIFKINTLYKYFLFYFHPKKFKLIFFLIFIILIIYKKMNYSIYNILTIYITNISKICIKY